MVKPRSSNLCDPRFATPRRPERETLGPAIGQLAALIGHPLLPWQQLVADVGGELDVDGVPCYRQVTFTVPRQSGKTTLILAWELQRAIGWTAELDIPQRIAYSAQTGKDAREKLLEDQVPLLERHRKTLGVRKVSRTNGSESVLWANGSRIVLLASGAESGHGKTIDLGVMDELFADVDFRREQALDPAMATRTHGQLLAASTMGTPESVAWNAAVDTGRRAVREDRDRGVAYFEWSADPDDEPGDAAVWWRCMPALGRTISLPVVENAYTKLPLEEFRRAYLNISTATVDDRVIPLVAWRAVCAPDLEATGEVFAIDVNPERSAAAIVAVGPGEHGPVVEVVDYRPGVAWVVERAGELHRKYGASFAFDAGGPVGAFTDELEREKVATLAMDGAAMRRATAQFFDRVMSGALRVRSHPDFDRAVEGAARRVVNDTWVWGRKSSRYDIALLVAATCGVWALENRKPPRAPLASFG